MAKKSKKAPAKKAAKKAAPKPAKKAAPKSAKKVAPKAVRKGAKKAIAKAPPKKAAAKKVAPKKTAPKAAAPKTTKASSKLPNAFFAPIEDRVLIARTGESDRTPGGLYIPEVAMDRPNKGKVLAVGKGRVNKKGHLRPLDVQVGDVVLFGAYVGQQLEHGGQEYVLCREDEILGVVEE